MPPGVKSDCGEYCGRNGWARAFRQNSNVYKEEDGVRDFEFSVEMDWAQKPFEFSEEQWRKIVNALRPVKVLPNTRHWLGQIAWTHVFHRRQPSDAPLSWRRKRLERIAKASALLRDAIEDQQDSWLRDCELARAASGCDFKTDLRELMLGWHNFQRGVEALHKKAHQEALSCSASKAKPANVDKDRNYTLESLAEVYEELTGKPPKPRVGVDERNEGIAYGPFVDFVIAFMETLPGNERVTGDQINHFLRRRNAKGERY
jgi:hypothetical protein